MKFIYTFIFIIIIFIISCNNSPKIKLEAADPSFHEIIDANAKGEIIAEGFTWSEGPVWLENEKMLLWTDVPENIAWSWREGEEKKEYLMPSGYTGDKNREGANGLIINQKGQLVLCQHGDRKVAIMDVPLDAPKSKFDYIATDFQGKKFNSPNDIIQDKDGVYWFTDPPYGLPKQDDDPDKELTFQGVFRTGTATDGEEIVLLTDKLTRPNGLALSSDERYLYVANSDPDKAIWMKYELDENKKIVGEGEVLFDATDWVKAGKKGLPDGLKIRRDETIFATGPGGVLVFNSNGKYIGTINTGQATANCALNSDETMLYMTADNYVMRIALKK